MTRKKVNGPTITTTKVDADLIRRARMVANHEGVTLFDLLDEVIRTAIERKHAKMVRELSESDKQ